MFVSEGLCLFIITPNFPDASAKSFPILLNFTGLYGSALILRICSCCKLCLLMLVI